MPRALGAFLVVFSVLSLVVHLDRMCELFAAFALAIFAFDQAAGYYRKLAQPHVERVSLPSNSLDRD